MVGDGDLWVPRAGAREPKATQPKRGRALFPGEIKTVCSRLADRAASALEAISRRDDAPLRSMDLVGDRVDLDEANETAVLATKLTARAFGKRIL